MVKYDQLVVMQGCEFNQFDKKYFLGIFKKHGFRKPKIVGVVETLQSRDDKGNRVIGTGGRKDFFFYINNKDLHRFSSWRIVYGMMWWEDVLQIEAEIYPNDFKKKHMPRW